MATTITYAVTVRINQLVPGADESKIELLKASLEQRILDAGGSDGIFSLTVTDIVEQE